MHLRNPVHNRYFFPLSVTSKHRIFIYEIITTPLGFAVNFISMFSNTYFLQYPLNIIPCTFKGNIVKCFFKRNWKKVIWGASKQLLTSICYGIGLNVNVLVLVLSSESFMLTFIKVADLQGIEDFTDIF